MTQPLGTKKITQLLGRKNVLKIQSLVTNKIQEIGTDHLGLVWDTFWKNNFFIPSISSEEDLFPYGQWSRTHQNPTSSKGDTR